MSRFLRLALLAAAIGSASFLGGDDARAGRISDIRNTKHNLSATSTNTVKATSESQVCVFCHTPHAATSGATPLWNRAVKDENVKFYTKTYGSSSLDALAVGETSLNEPNGTSKLCLSCHDGTIAIGSVNVLNGVAATTIAMTGTNAGKMPVGTGADTGFTRVLGTDLSNDHPISFVYDDALALKDGELQKPSTSAGSPRLIDSRAVGYRPKFPLENGKLQCTTCHDPHIRDDSPAEGNIKFLRMNRFQKAAPSGTFSAANDILCLACHTKDGWYKSAHADVTVADETYTNAAATQRDFPTGTAVWQAGCLNCHDTHTVQGARRLLREGTNGPVNGQNAKAGGSSAIEQTCYQCHSSDTGGTPSITLTGQGGATFQVPNVKTDFTTLSNTRMPIDNQPEVHDIGNAPDVSQAGKDFIEDPAILNQRHVECTDCHNPHRVMKNKLAVGTGAVTAGTHNHATGHTNLASGVLRGTWGVEPSYASTSFMTYPTYTIKRGDPGASVTMATTDAYVTREYQVCLKCHSSYAYGTSPPSLGLSTGGTASGTNGLTIYTDQGMEFQAPTTHKGETTPSGWATNNHRSWHPVIGPTGRGEAARGSGTAARWLAPWNSATDLGNQTMYCSDCHGSTTANGTVVPNGNSGTENGTPWGPHGSSSKFILKGAWTMTTGSTSNTDLCFRCHSSSDYTTENSNRSGFCCATSNNLHGYHFKKVEKIRCTWCHVAVPHGWKNKAFLVNLNDVGPEVGLAAGTSAPTKPYNKPPYYLNAYLRVKTWKSSGNWSAGDCGTSSSSGRSWMQSTCDRGAN